MPSAGGLHFKAAATNRAAMGAKDFVIFVISWVNGDIGISLQLLDDIGVEFSDIIGLVSEEKKSLLSLYLRLSSFSSLKATS